MDEMILIADSGSSKTDWILMKDNQLIEKIETGGINPYFKNTEEIRKMLSLSFTDKIRSLVTNIYFYGAGCIKGKTDSIVSDALIEIFPLANICIEDDMLGAARSLLGRSSGIACILGTGSNTCSFDGEKIVDKVPALGFILGDEGSGSYLGKAFLNNYFKRSFPEDLMQLIDADEQLEMTEVLTAVYRKEYPNRYLAGFSKIIYKHRDHPYISKLIKNSFEAFFTNNIERYPSFQSSSVCFVGSIAFYYSEILLEVANERNIEIGKILHKPIEGLMDYHRI